MSKDRSDDDDSVGSSEDSSLESSEEGSSDESEESSEGKKPDQNVKNMPFDEALELSASMDPGAAKNERAIQNAPHDEEFDVSASMDQSEANQGKKALQASINNKPYDEQVAISDSDSESSIDTNANSPRLSGGNSAQPKQSQPKPQAGAKSTHNTQDESDEESSSSEEESNDTAPAGAVNKLPAATAGNGSGGVDGGYKPEAYNNLNVSAEVKELFQYIQRYSPHDVELETRLKCFVPDYIPAVGELDAFLKVPRPDGESDELGLKMLDEPASHQSDPTVLELQLRAISKKRHGEAAVRSIENAEKTPKEITKWIESIEKLHRSKPPCQVHYTKAMPEIETLMQIWPEQFEAMLAKGDIQLPSVDLDLSIQEYAKLICILLDIPVYEGKQTESLHVLFTLFSEFKNNQHFMGMGAEGGEAGMDGMGGGMDAGGADIMTMEKDYK